MADALSTDSSAAKDALMEEHYGGEGNAVLGKLLVNCQILTLNAKVLTDECEGVRALVALIEAEHCAGGVIGE